jgi:hypothetical protein
MSKVFRAIKEKWLSGEELLHYAHVTKLFPICVGTLTSGISYGDLPRPLPLTCVVAGRNSFSVWLLVEFAAIACKRLFGDLDHNVDIKLAVVHLYRKVTLFSWGNLKWLMFKWVRWRLYSGFYSLWRPRGRVCRLQLLLVLASAVILESGTRTREWLRYGSRTIFYCLRFETCLFVASYDSQGYGGGIRPRLHTGLTKL